MRHEAARTHTPPESECRIREVRRGSVVRIEEALRLKIVRIGIYGFIVENGPVSETGKRALNRCVKEADRTSNCRGLLNLRE